MNSMQYPFAFRRRMPAQGRVAKASGMQLYLVALPKSAEILPLDAGRDRDLIRLYNSLGLRELVGTCEAGDAYSAARRLLAGRFKERRYAPKFAPLIFGKIMRYNGEQGNEKTLKDYSLIVPASEIPEIIDENSGKIDSDSGLTRMLQTGVLAGRIACFYGERDNDNYWPFWDVAKGFVNSEMDRRAVSEKDKLLFA